MSNALSITAVDDSSLTCQCAGAVLVNTDTDEQLTAAGTFVAIVE